MTQPNELHDSDAFKVTRIRATRGWASLNLGEVWEYRELLYFLVWRDVKVRYKQTVLGAAWAILQPFMTMVVFSLFFGKLGKMPSDGVIILELAKPEISQPGGSSSRNIDHYECLVIRSESLEPGMEYQVTVERIGGKIQRFLKNLKTQAEEPPLCVIDTNAIYDGQNHIGFHTFSAEAEFYDIEIYTRRSLFSIGQFRIPV